MTATVDNGTVHAALELGGRAPSVHHTQRWRWRMDEPDLLAVVALRPGAERVDRALASEQVVAMRVRRSDRRRVGCPPAMGPIPPRTVRPSSVYEAEDQPSDQLPTVRVRSAP